MKRILIISGSVIIIGIIGVMILLSNGPNYEIRVSLVDDHSPDRILTVYNEKNEKVEVKKIKYLDGTDLCNGYNTTVYYGDIEEEKELIIILKDNSEIKAKIVKEEVK